MNLEWCKELNARRGINSLAIPIDSVNNPEATGGHTICQTSCQRNGSCKPRANTTLTDDVRHRQSPDFLGIQASITAI